MPTCTAVQATHDLVTTKPKRKIKPLRKVG